MRRAIAVTCAAPSGWPIRAPCRARSRASISSSKLETKFATGGGFTYLSHDRPSVGGTESPWIYSSWARGLSRCSIPLLGPDDGPAAYTVKLLFAEPDDGVQPGQRVFDVKLQGRTVLENFDIAAAGGVQKALQRQFENIQVADALLLELVPHGESAGLESQPAISGLELRRVKD